MPPRIKSPFNPGRPAVVEPIVQPLYDKKEFSAAGPSKVTFFAQSIGTGVLNELDTNLDAPNALPAPKIFVILGLRLHYSQLGDTAQVSVAFQQQDILKIAYSYWFKLFVGAKEYLKVPAFYLSSGLGFFGGYSSAAAESAFGQMGWPTFHSHMKIDRHPITIPPVQNFRCEMNQGVDLVAELSEARDVWCFLEGDFGREVQ